MPEDLQQIETSIERLEHIVDGIGAETFYVAVVKDKGSWSEHFSTEAELFAFFRGMQAMAGLLGIGHWSAPGIPAHPTQQIYPGVLETDT